MVEHALGHAAESQRAVTRLIGAPWALGASYQIAQVQAFRGETDRAFEWLEHAYEQHDPGLSYLKTDPFLRGLRPDPRYAALLRKMKLPLG